MAVVVLEPYVEKHLLAERVGSDGEQYDVVWEGVYAVTPLPNNDLQEIVCDLASILREAVRRTGLVKACDSPRMG